MRWQEKDTVRESAADICGSTGVHRPIRRGIKLHRLDGHGPRVDKKTSSYAEL